MLNARLTGALSLVAADRRELLWGAGATAALRGLSLALTVLNLALLARMLGLAEFGLYALCLALAMLAALPVVSGFSMLVIREASWALQEDQPGLFRGVLWFAYGVAVATFAIAMAALWLAPSALYHSGMLMGLAPLALCVTPLHALTAIQIAALKSLGRSVQAQLPENLLKPSFQLLTLLFLWRSEEALSARSALFVLLGASALAALCGGAMLWRASPRAQLRGVRPIWRVRAWLRSAFPMSLTGLIHSANDTIMLLVLGWMAAPETAGLYRIALRGASFVGYLQQVTQQVAGPLTARLWAAGRRAALQRTLSLCAWAASLCAALMLGVFIIFGEALIAVAVGGEYAASLVPLLIFGFAYLVNSLIGFPWLTLVMSGHERDVLRIVSFIAPLVLLGAAFAIPPWGAQGAAAVASMGLIAVDVAMWRMAWKRIGVDASIAGALRAPRPASI